MVSILFSEICSECTKHWCPWTVVMFSSNIGLGLVEMNMTTTICADLPGEVARSPRAALLSKI